MTSRGEVCLESGTSNEARSQYPILLVSVAQGHILSRGRRKARAEVLITRASSQAMVRAFIHVNN